MVLFCCGVPAVPVPLHSAVPTSCTQQPGNPEERAGGREPLVGRTKLITRLQKVELGFIYQPGREFITANEMKISGQLCRSAYEEGDTSAVSRSA